MVVVSLSARMLAPNLLAVVTTVILLLWCLQPVARRLSYQVHDPGKPRS
jgi:hypothetical protein